MKIEWMEYEVKVKRNNDFTPDRKFSVLHFKLNGQHMKSVVSPPMTKTDQMIKTLQQIEDEK